VVPAVMPPTVLGTVNESEIVLLYVVEYTLDTIAIPAFVPAVPPPPDGPVGPTGPVGPVGPGTVLAGPCGPVGPVFP
jgi:hypothetical protein